MATGHGVGFWRTHPLPGLLRLPSFGLLLSLAALILLEPFAERLRGGVSVLAALHLAVLGLAVRMVSRARGEVWITWILALPTIALNLGSLFFERPVLAIGDLAMLAVFYAYVIRCLLAYVLRDAIVTVDELYAATCTYVLMAMFFACLYTIIERLSPGAFAIAAAGGDDPRTRYWDLLYFRCWPRSTSWRAASCASSRSCWCSTSRPPRSTPRPSTRSSSAMPPPRAATRSRCWSRTASAPCAWPTGSWCWTARVWPRSAATRS